MRKHLLYLLCIVLSIIVSLRVACQDNNTFSDKVLAFPDKVFASIDKQTEALQQKLTQQTLKYLQKLQKQEDKLRRKMMRHDSTAAKELFGTAAAKYKSWGQQLQGSCEQLQQYGNLYSSMPIYIILLKPIIKKLEEFKEVADWRIIIRAKKKFYCVFNNSISDSSLSMHHS